MEQALYYRGRSKTTAKEVSDLATSRYHVWKKLTIEDHPDQSDRTGYDLSSSLTHTHSLSIALNGNIVL